MYFSQITDNDKKIPTKYMSSKKLIEMTHEKLVEIILDDRIEVLRNIAEMGAYGEYNGREPVNLNWKVFLDYEWDRLAKTVVNIPTSQEKVKKETTTRNKMATVIQKFIKEKKEYKSKTKCANESYLKKHIQSKLRRCPNTMTCRKNPHAKGKRCFLRKSRKKNFKSHIRIVNDGLEI